MHDRVLRCFFLDKDFERPFLEECFLEDRSLSESESESESDS